MARNNYGDIKYGDYKRGTLESIKGTTARLEALELAYDRGETIDSDNEAVAIDYLEQWYYFDYAARCWRPK